MDRRSFQVNSAILNSAAKCIHTKNVFSIFDLSAADEGYHRIKKHVDSCSTCNTELEKFELENLEVKIHIPKPHIDLDTKQVFSNEVSEIFKAFDLNEKALLKKKIKSKIKSIDTYGTTFINVLTSKKMITTYAMGAVMFVILRHYF